jgi:O-antigen/teichoic acid export membrane protein
LNHILIKVAKKFMSPKEGTRGNKYFISKVINSSIGSAVRALGGGSTLLIYYLVSQSSNVETLGLFIIVLTSQNISSQIARGGLDNILIRKISNLLLRSDSASISSFVSIACIGVLRRSFYIAFLNLILILVASEFIDQYKPLRIVLLTSFFMISSQSLSYLIGEVKKSYGDATNAAIIQNLAIPILMVAQILILKAVNIKLNIYSLSGIYVISLGVALLYACFSAKSFLNYQEIKSSWKKKTQLKRQNLIARPIFIATGYGIILAWSDILALSLFRGASDVAIYGTASKVAMIFGLLIASVNSVIAPEIANAYLEKNMKKFRDLSQISTRLMLVVSAPIIALIEIFAKNIMTIFGQEFLIGGLLLQILCFGQLINIACGSVGYVLSMSKNDYEVKKIVEIVALFNILGVGIFSYLWGAVGASLIAMFTICGWNILMLLKIKKIFGFWMFAR